MIRKLRIKFVVINMSIFTLMLTIILGLVFCFTGARMGTENIQMMQSLPVGTAEHGSGQIAQQMRLPYFAIRLGPGGERISVSGSYYDLTNEAFLDDVVVRANAIRRQTGVLEKYSLRYCFVNAPHSRYLVFSDISSELAALDNLKSICLTLGVLGFFVFLALSIWLSGWAVRPIDEALHQQRRFVADASHELKTPLTVLMTNAQLMQSPACTPAVRDKCLDGILTMSRQMKHLIEDLLELARMDAETVQPLQEELDLSELAGDAILPFEPVFFEQELVLDSDIQEGIRVRGSRDQLRELVEILLDNAQKYTTPGGKAVLRLQKQARGRCLLSVASEGDSLSPDQLQALFTRFYRADQARPRDGSFGLGLSIAQAIVRAHHGKLWVQSRDGINTFFAEFPTSNG